MDRYRTRTVEVEAMRLGTAITLGRGEKGKKGDWLIRGPGHHLSVLDAKTFGIRFEFVPATPTAEDPLAKKGRRGGRRPGPGRTSKRGGGGTPRTARSARSAEPGPGRVRSIGGSSARALPSEAKREKCRKLYEGGMELVAISAQEGVKYPTLYGWKTNGEWERN